MVVAQAGGYDLGAIDPLVAAGLDGLGRPRGKRLR
jgi:hypothetical protein